MSKKDGSNNNYEFGRRLTEVLERRRMKMYHIASECDVSKSALCHYYYGVRMPRVDIFMKIARAMNFTDEEIVYVLGAFTKDWCFRKDGEK